MPTAKVLARGQVTIPRDVRRKAGIRPGDTLAVRVIGEHRIELEVERKMTLEEAWERWQSVTPTPDFRRVREEAEAKLADELI